jgi:hypothetical protein
VTLEFSVKIDADAFKSSIDDTADRYEEAFATAKNMIASMMLSEVTKDIQSAGNFGGKFLSGLSVTVDGDTITTTLDAPGANVFEEGGTIHGNPLLWLPISGTDAEGIQASDYGDQMFSVNRKAGGPPLLFSMRDRSPKYFGVPSVEIPKKFHIGEIQTRVMDNFLDVFQTALETSP